MDVNNLERYLYREIKRFEKQLFGKMTKKLEEATRWVSGLESGIARENVSSLVCY